MVEDCLNPPTDPMRIVRVSIMSFISVELLHVETIEYYEYRM